MATSTENPTVQGESKSARKKKTKAAEAAALHLNESGSTPSVEQIATELKSELAVNGVDGQNDSPFIKELNK